MELLRRKATGREGEEEKNTRSNQSHYVWHGDRSTGRRVRLASSVFSQNIYSQIISRRNDAQRSTCSATIARVGFPAYLYEFALAVKDSQQWLTIIVHARRFSPLVRIKYVRFARTNVDWWWFFASLSVDFRRERERERRSCRQGVAVLTFDVCIINDLRVAGREEGAGGEKGERGEGHTIPRRLWLAHGLDVNCGFPNGNFSRTVSRSDGW